MKKLISASVAALVIAGAAHAGNVVYIPPEMVAIEEPMRAGIGNWLIPLAIIAIVALALTSSDDEPRDPCRDAAPC